MLLMFCTCISATLISIIVKTLSLSRKEMRERGVMNKNKTLEGERDMRLLILEIEREKARIRKKQ